MPPVATIPMRLGERRATSPMILPNAKHRADVGCGKASVLKNTGTTGTFIAGVRKHSVPDQNAESTSVEIGSVLSRNSVHNESKSRGVILSTPG